MAATTAETLRLRQVGFSDDQVEALDAFIRPSVATKADLAEVRVNLADLRAALAHSEARLVRWMIGALAAQGAIVIAAVRLIVGPMP